jgi:hypothetical protein
MCMHTLPQAFVVLSGLFMGYCDTVCVAFATLSHAIGARTAVKNIKRGLAGQVWRVKVNRKEAKTNNRKSMSRLYRQGNKERLWLVPSRPD